MDAHMPALAHPTNEPSLQNVTAPSLPTFHVPLMSADITCSSACAAFMLNKTNKSPSQADVLIAQMIRKRKAERWPRCAVFVNGFRSGESLTAGRVVVPEGPRERAQRNTPR